MCTTRFVQLISHIMYIFVQLITHGISLYIIVFSYFKLQNTYEYLCMSFISKIIHKTIATRLHSHLVNNDIDNGVILVLLYLFAVFDTIDNDNLFCILEKYVGMCGNTLKLIKSFYF